MTQPRYSAAETVRRAEELYEQRPRSQVEQGNVGRYIAIDVDTGQYQIGDDYHAVARGMLDQNPAAALGVLRIGHRAVGRIGIRARTASL